MRDLITTKKIVLNTIIYYDNYDEVLNYINDVIQINSDIFISIVVNKNTCTKNDLNGLILNNNIYIFDPKQNLGYMNGMIYGYYEFKNKTGIYPDYVLMSNTDIKYNKDFFSILNQKNYSEDIWCIGPSIFSKCRSSFDNPVLYERLSKSQLISKINFLSIPFIGAFYVKLSDMKAKLKKRPESNSSIVYQVHGSCFIIRNVFANLLCENKYGMLLYSEESFISEEVRKHGKTTFYDCDLKIIHYDHSVTKKIKKSKIAKLNATSMKYIMEKYYE